MKQIKLYQIFPPRDKSSIYLARRKYVVQLGRTGKKWEFGSEKKAGVFLAEANRVINRKWSRVNGIYCEVYCLYRENWRSLDFDSEKWFEETDRNIRFNLKYMVERHGGPNGPFHITQKFRTVFQDLESMRARLAQLPNLKAAANTREMLNEIAERIHYHRESFSQFLATGAENAGGIEWREGESDD